MVAAIPASPSFEALWAHRQTGEPKLASLWSHRQPGARHKQSPRSGISFACLLLLVLAVSQEISYGLLSTSNGRIVSFLKSVHMVNYYWPKSRLSARSLLGCTLLKFVGSSLISFALGEGLLIASPRHLLSFVCAWSLVRSDSVEATQLSRLLRHSVPLHLLLNFTAAIYKLRKLGFLVAQSSKLGSLETVLLGTAAFSAANFIMKLESLVLTHVVGIPLCSPPMRPAKAAAASAASVPDAAATAAFTAGSLPPLMTLPETAPAPARAKSTPVGRGSVDDIMTPDLDLDLLRDLGTAASSSGGRADCSLTARHAADAAPSVESSGSFKRELSERVEPPNMPKAVFQNFCLVATLVSPSPSHGPSPSRGPSPSHGPSPSRGPRPTWPQAQPGDVPDPSPGPNPSPNSNPTLTLIPRCWARAAAT